MMTIQKKLVISIDAAGHETFIEAASIKCPGVAEVAAGNAAQDALIHSFMLGCVSPAWRKIIDNDLLPERLPGYRYKNQRSAINKLAGVPADAIQAAWVKHVEEVKTARARGEKRRLTPPTWQKLVALVFPPKPKAERFDYKAAAIAAATAAHVEGDMAKLSTILWDIAQEAELLGEDSTPIF